MLQFKQICPIISLQVARVVKGLNNLFRMCLTTQPSFIGGRYGFDRDGSSLSCASEVSAPSSTTSL